MPSPKDLTPDEERARERKRKRIMRAFDTNPLLCAPCNITFAHYHAKVLEFQRWETWHDLPAEWREDYPRPEFEPLICQHRQDPENCKMMSRWRELFEDPVKPLRFPGKRKRQVRKRPSP